jgi:hypothetical protein
VTVQKATNLPQRIPSGAAPRRGGRPDVGGALRAIREGEDQDLSPGRDR